MKKKALLFYLRPDASIARLMTSHNTLQFTSNGEDLNEEDHTDDDDFWA